MHQQLEDDDDDNEMLRLRNWMGTDELHQHVEEDISMIQPVEMSFEEMETNETYVQESEMRTATCDVAASDAGVMVNAHQWSLATMPVRQKMLSNKKDNSTDGDEMVNRDMLNSGVSHAKPRKNLSRVWNHFKRSKGQNGRNEAVCSYCGNKLGADSSKGTTPLWNHLKSCSQRRNKESVQVQQSTSDVETRKETVPCPVNGRNSEIDQDIGRLDALKRIIMSPCTLEMVELLYGTVMTHLQPVHELPSQYNITADILRVYGDEKAKIKNCLGKLHCHLSLSMNLWSDKRRSFCCLTLHFINEGWQLEKKIIAFKQMEYESTVQFEPTAHRVIKNELSEWGIGKNLCFLTVKNPFPNDEMMTDLKWWLTERKTLPMRGKLFQVDCFVHVINVMVQEILQEIHTVAVKIRMCIIYINGMQQKMQRNEIPSLDVTTMWDSTYIMLKRAVELRESFCRVEETDNDFTINPSTEEWDKAEITCKCFKVFYDLLGSLEGSKLTANVYFAKVSQTYLNLLRWEKSQSVSIREMTNRMKVKFEKYWEKCNLVLAAAVILDPRFKFQFVEFLYKQIYGRDASARISEIRVALAYLFDAYAIEARAASASGFDGTNCSASDHFVDDVVEAFAKESEIDRDVTSHGSELDVYLEEPRLDPKDVTFDILDWWRANSSKFPVLGTVARDILAIPMRTCEIESAFSMDGIVIDPTINCSDPDMVEPWMCARDWLWTLRN